MLKNPSATIQFRTAAAYRNIPRLSEDFKQPFLRGSRIRRVAVMLLCQATHPRLFEILDDISYGIVSYWWVCVDADSNSHSHDRVGIYATFLRVGILPSPFGAASAKETAHGLIFRDFERRFAV